MALLPRPVISSTSVSPADTASSTTYWMAGLSTTGSSSLGTALVAGRNRVPRPAAGMTALVHPVAAAPAPVLSMLDTLAGSAAWPRPRPGEQGKPGAPGGPWEGAPVNEVSSAGAAGVAAGKRALRARLLAARAGLAEGERA